MARQAELIETADDEVAALAILVAHMEHRVAAVAQGLDGGLLAHDGRAHNAILVHLEHAVDDGGGTAGVADAEASHRESL